MRCAFFILISNFLLFHAMLSAPTPWERLPNLPFPNAGPGLTARNHFLLITGGTHWYHDTKIWNNDLWLFDTTTRQWAKAGELDTPFAFGAVAATPGEIIIRGGDNGGLLINREIRLDSTDFHPLTSRPAHPPAAAYPGYAQSGNILHIVGGMEDPKNWDTLSGQWIQINLDNPEAIESSPYPGGPAFLPAVAASGQYLLVAGGARMDATNNTLINLDSVFLFDFRKNTWEQLPDFPFAARGLSAVFLDENHACLGGGYRSGPDGFTDEAYILDIAKRQYHPAPNLPSKALAHMIRIRDTVYHLGGEDKARSRLDDFHEATVQSLLHSLKD